MKSTATIPSNVYMTLWDIPRLKISQIFILKDAQGHSYVQNIYSWLWLTGFEWDDPEAFHLQKGCRVRDG